VLEKEKDMKRKISRKKWILIGVVSLVVLAGIVYYAMGTPVPVQMARAGRGSIDAYVEERARTTLPHVVRLTMPLEGRIQPITLEAGTPVKAGEVVAMMDLADLKDMMAESEDVVNAMDQVVASAREKVKASQAQMAFADWFLDAQETLYKKKQISESLLRVSKKNAIESRVDHRADWFTLHAMSALSEAVDLYPTFVRRRLERAVLTSPIDGVVLERHVQNERVLQAGMPLLDIGDMQQLEVTADILSDQAVAIRPGNPVQIYGDSIGKHPITGTVRLVSPQGFTKLSSLGVEEQRVAVKISLNPADRLELTKRGKDLGVQYRVQVRVITQTHDNVIKIPRTALFRGAGDDWEAYLVKKGKARLTRVKVGITNDSDAEIVEGIAEGDTVVVAPDSSLSSGAKVTEG